VQLRWHTEKLLREAGPGIKRGPHFPIQPADVVLPGGEANLVVGHRCREAPVAPRARHLAGKPGVARLWNGDHIESVPAKQQRYPALPNQEHRIASASTSHKTWAADSAAARVLASVRFFAVNVRDARPGDTVM